MAEEQHEDEHDDNAREDDAQRPSDEPLGGSTREVHDGGSRPKAALEWTVDEMVNRMQWLAKWGRVCSFVRRCNTAKCSG